MTTPITPLRPSAIADLRNALQLAVTYGDAGVADADAKQALGRIRGLVQQAIDKLGEPNKAAIQATRAMLPDVGYVLSLTDRDIRDTAATILYAAVTGEVVGESGYAASLPCPQCHGDGQVGIQRDGQPIVCDQCRGTGIPR